MGRNITFSLKDTQTAHFRENRFVEGSLRRLFGFFHNSSKVTIKMDDYPKTMEITPGRNPIVFGTDQQVCHVFLEDNEMFTSTRRFDHKEMFFQVYFDKKFHSWMILIYDTKRITLIRNGEVETIPKRKPKVEWKLEQGDTIMIDEDKEKLVVLAL